MDAISSAESGKLPLVTDADLEDTPNIRDWLRNLESTKPMLAKENHIGPDHVNPGNDIGRTKTSYLDDARSRAEAIMGTTFARVISVLRRYATDLQYREARRCVYTLFANYDTQPYAVVAGSAQQILTLSGQISASYPTLSILLFTIWPKVTVMTSPLSISTPKKELLTS